MSSFELGSLIVAIVFGTITVMIAMFALIYKMTRD